MWKYILASVLGVVGMALYFYFGFIVNDNRFFKIVLAIPVIYVFFRLAFSKRTL